MYIACIWDLTGEVISVQIAYTDTEKDKISTINSITNKAILIQNLN